MGIHVFTEVKGVWPDLKEKAEKKKVLHYTGELSIGRAAGGAVIADQPQSTIVQRIDLENGMTVIIEHPLPMFLQAIEMLKQAEWKANGGRFSKSDVSSKLLLPQIKCMHEKILSECEICNASKPALPES